MTRAELAAMVNDYVHARTGRMGGLRGKDVWRYERGEVRWPSRLYREALRAVLKAGSDQEVGFAPTPRGTHPPSAGVAVRAVIRQDNSVLVARRRGQGWAFLPGGRVGSGEAVEGGLLREVATQVGAPVRIIRFVGAVEHGDAQDSAPGPVITLAFEVEITAPAGLCPARDFDVEWLPVADLTNYDVRPAALSRALIDSADETFWHSRNH
jgi:8-oxo-dGTP pyrophosphatase MutT (NUDIX family)